MEGSGYSLKQKLSKKHPQYSVSEPSVPCGHGAVFSLFEYFLRIGFSLLVPQVRAPPGKVLPGAEARRQRPAQPAGTARFGVGKRLGLFLGRRRLRLQ